MEQWGEFLLLLSPLHWFRWFSLASSLVLVQKNTLIHGTASSEEGEVPLPGAQLLCCVSQRNLLMKHGANNPPRGQVPQGSAVQCCVVIPSPSAQAKASCSFCSITCEEKSPCMFSRVKEPSVSPRNMGCSQWLLQMRYMSCLYTFPGRSWVSKLC